MTSEEIKQKAVQVSEVSLEYHLAHEVLACGEVVKSQLKHYVTEKTRQLEAELKAVEKIADPVEKEQKVIEIVKKIRRLKMPLAIRVEFDDVSVGENGDSRVIYFLENNEFVIEIPRAMVSNSLNKDGSVNAQGAEALRWEMACNIGHIALHATDILEGKGFAQGDSFSEADLQQKNAEAELFANELLRLREGRNKLLRNN